MAYGIRAGTELVRFSPSAPTIVESLGNFGVGMADPIVGLDRRPADNGLYAVSRSGRVFLVQVVESEEEGEPAMFTEVELQAIMGAGTELGAGRIGVDFNPAANALRVIDDGGLNLRVPTAALANPAPGTPVNTLIDGRMGYRQGVTSAAYSNPHPGFVPAEGDPATRLFVIDSENDALYLQNANAGEMTFVADLSVGVEADNGYDIYQGAADGINEHYVISNAILYRLNPLTGELAAVATPDAVNEVKGLVVVTNEDSAIPIPGIPPLLQRRALVLDNSGATDVIRTFVFNRLPPLDPVSTGVTTSTINGLEAGERLVGIDSRTTSMIPDRVDELYAVTTNNRVVALVEGGGNEYDVADAVTLSTPLEGMDFAVDFNPSVDLLRILSDLGQNLRVNLQAGREIDGEARVAGFALVDRTTRITTPNPADGLPPQIVATAYRAAAVGGTFQFAIDAENSSLVRVVEPNDGALELVGPLGGGLTLPLNAEDGAAEQSLDISGAGDTAYASLMTVGATRSALHTINLNTGTATLVGSIGAAGSAPVESITVRFE